MAIYDTDMAKATYDIAIEMTAPTTYLFTRLESRAWSQ